MPRCQYSRNNVLTHPVERRARACCSGTARLSETLIPALSQPQTLDPCSPAKTARITSSADRLTKRRRQKFEKHPTHYHMGISSCRSRKKEVTTRGLVLQRKQKFVSHVASLVRQEREIRLNIWKQKKHTSVEGIHTQALLVQEQMNWKGHVPLRRSRLRVPEAGQVPASRPALVSVQ